MSDVCTYTAASPPPRVRSFKSADWLVDCPPLDGEIGPDTPVRVKFAPKPRPGARKLRRCKGTPDLFEEKKK